MSGKAIAVGVLLLGIGGLAVVNWWTYFKEEASVPRRVAAATARSAPALTGAATAPAKRSEGPATAAGPENSAVTAQESEPPKRRPKSGLTWNDPFVVENADVVLRPPAGVRRAPKPPKPAYVVDLILIDGSRRRASINGRLYSTGEWIGPAEVVRIERDGVLLRGREGKDLFVRLAELKAGKS
jgi:hypothetical protein